MNQRLWKAAGENNVSMLKDLLDYSKYGDTCAQVNAKSADDWTALHISANEGATDVLKALLEYIREVDVSAVSTTGSTALHLAAIKGYLDCVQILVSGGADINAKDNEGNTPLHLASMNGHTGTVSWLLGKDPQVESRNKYEMTAYEVAASEDVGQCFELYFAGRSIPYRKSKPLPTVFTEDEDSGQDLIDRLMNRLKRDNTPTALRLFIERASTPVYDIIRPSNAPRTPSPSRRSKSTAISDYLDFELQYLLGRGSFGDVYLVKHRETGQLYAMKVLSKEKIISRNLMNYAITERNVMSYITHPFIVGLNFAFQTNTKLVLIMDYCPGGDLGKLLEREGRVEESRARIYAAEVLLALDGLHSHDIIYRDLKPDNVVIDADGHVMLTDFGLSKEGITDSVMAQSFCGSVAYLAPEVLNRKGHGKGVDWYLLGVLLFEMIVGTPPYFTPNPQEMFKNIRTAPLVIPEYVSLEARDLLEGLLKRDPRQRLGANGVADIKSHPFFEGIDWEAVLRRELHPPPPILRSRPSKKLRPEDVLDILSDVSERHKVPQWSFIHQPPALPS